MLYRKKRGGHFYPVEVFVPGGFGAGACLAEFRKGIKPKIPGKIIQKVAMRMGAKLFLPVPVRYVFIACRSIKYIWKGICALGKGKMEVSVLDGTAIAVSLLRGNISTAGSVMFLLGIGEVLEEWTHKRSVDDLARSMSLNIGKVWMIADGKEVLADTDEVGQGDFIVVRMGGVIPFDGVVTEGSGEVNQAALTGEALPVSRETGGYVYAGTVLEAGELVIQVAETSGSNKYEKIVRMIEESERLKSSAESRAAHLADRLVPYTLLGAVSVYLLTRNAQKALSVLMVDFSCALKLAMPIAVLSAIREAGTHRITVKGGKFLERVAEADTIILDKTGTITRAHPTVAGIVPFHQEGQEELLGLAACLWRSTSRIPWQGQLCGRRRSGGLTMKRGILRWNILWRMGFHLWLTEAGWS